MAKIYIKGVGQIEEKNKDIVRKLESDWKNKNVSRDTIVSIGNWTGKIEDIRSIFGSYSYEAKDHEEEMQKFNEKYLKWRSTELKRSPEDRGKEIGMESLWWWINRDKKEIPENIKIEVIKRKTEFFRENPNRVYCNPVIFRDLFENKIEDVGKKLNIWTDAGVRLLERCISEDKFQERQEIKNKKVTESWTPDNW